MTPEGLTSAVNSVRTRYVLRVRVSPPSEQSYIPKNFMRSTYWLAALFSALVLSGFWLMFQPPSNEAGLEPDQPLHGTSANEEKPDNSLRDHEVSDSIRQAVGHQSKDGAEQALEFRFSDGRPIDPVCLFFVHPNSPNHPQLEPLHSIGEVVGCTRSGFVFREPSPSTDAGTVTVGRFLDFNHSVRALGQCSPFEVWSIPSHMRGPHAVIKKALHEVIEDVYKCLLEGRNEVASTLWLQIKSHEHFWRRPVVAFSTHNGEAQRATMGADSLFLFMPDDDVRADFSAYRSALVGTENGTLLVDSTVDMYERMSTDMKVQEGSSIDVELVCWENATIMGTLFGLSYDEPYSKGLSNVQLQHVEIRDGIEARETESMDSNTGPSFVLENVRPGAKALSITHYLDSDYCLLYSHRVDNIQAGELVDVGELSPHPWRVQIRPQLETPSGAALPPSILEQLDGKYVRATVNWDGDDGSVFGRIMNIDAINGLTIEGLGPGDLVVLPWVSGSIRLSDETEADIKGLINPERERTRPIGAADWTCPLTYQVELED